MPQLPNQTRLDYVLTRASVLHGEETAERMADELVADWTAAAVHGHEQAMHAAVWQLVRAASMRALGQSSVANMHCHLAEACIAGYRDEVTVQLTTVEDAPPT